MVALENRNANPASQPVGEGVGRGEMLGDGVGWCDTDGRGVGASVGQGVPMDEPVVEMVSESSLVRFTGMFLCVCHTPPRRALC